MVRLYHTCQANKIDIYFILISGRSLVVELVLPKHRARVRFSPTAQKFFYFTRLIGAPAIKALMFSIVILRISATASRV